MHHKMPDTGDLMTRKDIQIAVAQVVLVIVSSFLTAREPEGWLSVLSYFFAVVFVPMMSRNFLMNLVLSIVHTFVLLSFIQLLGSIKGTVGGPVTMLVTPIMTITLYAAIYWGCMALRRLRP